MTGFGQGDALLPAQFNIALKSVIISVLIQAKGIQIEDDR